MKCRHIIFLLLTSTLFVVAACRSQRDTAATPDAPDAPATPTETARYTVITFTGTVDGISVNGQVRMAKDSLIWCSITKLLEVGRAMATPDSVWVRSSLLGVNEAGTFSQAQRRAKTDLTFSQMQELLMSDDAEQRLAEMSRTFGHPATVRITRRQQVDRLSFPFNK